ncbi:hypothetical protein FB451DRAFT_1177462 [Mycena latifolia]|nr:hypothetical protein FB451DRAFT_1177462 [Mycena latifolia]
MNFIKFGNHVIAPAGAEPTPIATTPTSDPVAEVLSLARLLQSKIKDLEKIVAERKARRQEWRTGVSRMDKILVALREQDSKEGDKLAKLAKRWNKRTITVNHHDLDATSEAPRYVFGLSRDYAREERFVCPTTQAASAFNGNNECYRDSYTFSGPAWQPAPAARSPYSSAASSPSGYHFMDERNSFHFAASPEALDTRRNVESYSADTTPTKHGDHRGALSDIRNTPQDVGESNGRKRKSATFDADEYDGPYKRTRVAEARRHGSGRRVGRRNSKRSSEMNY